MSDRTPGSARLTRRAVLAAPALAALGRTHHPSLFAAPATPPAAANDLGLIVYQVITPLSDTASPEAGLAVDLVAVRPDGTEVTRLDLPGLALMNPLGIDTFALASYGDTGPHLLIDAAGGEVRELPLPVWWDGPVLPAHWWRRTLREQRFALVFDGHPTSAALLDSATGDLIDLVSIVRAELGQSENVLVVPIAAELSSDETSLVFGTDRNTWIFPTDEPDRPRRLEGVRGGRADLSEDGERLLYVRPVGDEATEIVVSRLDGSEAEVVAHGDRFTYPRWVPDGTGTRALIVRLRGTTLLDLARGEARDLLAHAEDGVPYEPIFAPGGGQVLCLVVADERTAWTWLDLEADVRKELHALAGYPPFISPPPGARYLILRPNLNFDVEPGMRVLGLDLTNGDLRSLLTFEGEDPLVLIPRFAPTSSDGRFTIANDFGERHPRFWLLDATQSSRLVEGRLGAAFAPDGSALVALGPEMEAGTGIGPLVVMETQGEGEATLPEAGIGPLWLPLVPPA
jgi:hypothetical protein